MARHRRIEQQRSVPRTRSRTNGGRGESRHEKENPGEQPVAEDAEHLQRTRSVQVADAAGRPADQHEQDAPNCQRDGRRPPRACAAGREAPGGRWVHCTPSPPRPATVMNASSRSVCTSRNCVTPTPAAPAPPGVRPVLPRALAVRKRTADSRRRGRTSAPGSSCPLDDLHRTRRSVGSRQQHFHRPLLAQLPGDLVQRAKRRSRPP